MPRRHRHRHRNAGRRGHRPAQKKENIFTKALRSVPQPAVNQMVFPYDYKILDYNTNSFNAAKFNQALRLVDIEELKSGLRRKVSFYQVKEETEAVVNCVMCICCILGLMYLPLLCLFLCLGVVCLGCIGGHFQKKLIQREKQIRDYLNEVNRKVGDRGLRWSTGQYGTYLMVTYSGPGRAGGAQNRAPVVQNRPVRPTNPDQLPLLNSRIPLAQPVGNPWIIPYAAPVPMSVERNQVMGVGVPLASGPSPDLDGIIEIEVPRVPRDEAPVINKKLAKF